MGDFAFSHVGIVFETQTENGYKSIEGTWGKRDCLHSAWKTFPFLYKSLHRVPDVQGWVVISLKLTEWHSEYTGKYSYKITFQMSKCSCESIQDSQRQPISQFKASVVCWFVRGRKVRLKDNACLSSHCKSKDIYSALRCKNCPSIPRHGSIHFPRLRN